ncbi:MAG: FHA domain-containing protein [bacterium]|nr:FHA domain-containing protein [bacterium]
MSLDFTVLSRLPVSTGILYFLKYIFLAAILGFVYYVTKNIIASLRRASEEGQLAWQRSAEAIPTHNSGKSRHGVPSLSGADSMSAGKTAVPKSGSKNTGKAGSALPTLVDLPSDDEDMSTFSSLHAVIESSGFIEVISGAATKIKRIPIEKEIITFGRDRSCTIQIRDGFTSAHHAKIFADKDGVYLEDTGSRNGTFLGEQRISEAVALNDGDVFTVGDAVFRYTRF